MKKFLEKFLDKNYIRVFLIILGSIVSTLVLTFSILALIETQNNNLQLTSVYLLIIFILLGLSRAVTLIKERTKISVIRFIVLFTANIAIGILIMFAQNHPYLYSLCGGLFCATVVLSRIFVLIQNHSIRSIILNAIIILFFILLGIALFIPIAREKLGSIVVIICVVITISALFEILSNTMAQLKIITLFKIVMRTYALEVILGLFTMMVASSLIFMFYEDTITNFGDALWYSFAIVTTIGFGDYHAYTLVGRIVSVLLGIYGVLVIAIITSIIVNFYNETAGKKDAKELKDIKEEEKQNHPIKRR